MKRPAPLASGVVRGTRPFDASSRHGNFNEATPPCSSSKVSRKSTLARAATLATCVSCGAAQEMQLPLEIAGMDHPAQELGTAAYRCISPFEQIPAIDDDGVVVSESGAILFYLAKMSGRPIPSDRIGEAQVMRWRFAALDTVEMPLLALMVHDWTADETCKTSLLKAVHHSSAPQEAIW